MKTSKKAKDKLESMLSTLTREEKDLLNQVDRDLSLPAKKTNKKLSKLLETAVDNTLQKKKTISLRIGEQDLRRLKVKAAEIGVGYNSVITMLLRKYLNKI